jgi:glutaryl-CoA dehydrogenase
MAKASKARFCWEDPLLLDAQLSEDERLLRDAARDYCQGRLLPRVLESFRHERTDPAIYLEMGEMGLLGDDSGPVRRAGTQLRELRPGRARSRARRFGLSLDDERAVVAGDAADLPVRQRGTAPVPAAAGDRRMDRLLRPDRAQPRIRSRQHGKPRARGGRRLSAFRQQDVDHQLADRRRVHRLGQGRRGVDSRLRARPGMPGLSTPTIHGKVGLRTSITGEIVMDEVFVPEENAFPEVRGLKGPFTCLDSARYGIAWGALGAAEFCWHTARQYTLDRRQFGRPLGPTSWSRKSWPTCRPKSPSACRVACASGG